MTERHRPSEPFSPRPGDLISDRIRVLAAWAAIHATSVTIDGVIFDAEALERLAEAQAIDEAQLLEHWRRFRDFYAGYTERMKEREGILRAAIEQVSLARSDSDTKKALRLCRLRRPPLAKVGALVAEARLRTGTSG